MQITAELDSQHLEKLQFLEKLLHRNSSELIALAIDEIFSKNAERFPNEQSKIAMLDVRAKINLQAITVEQLQQKLEGATQ